jgi:hypothetical protein
MLPGRKKGMKQEVNGGFFNEVIDKCKLVIAQFTY